MSQSFISLTLVCSSLLVNWSGQCHCTNISRAKQFVVRKQGPKN